MNRYYLQEVLYDFLCGSKIGGKLVSWWEFDVKGHKSKKTLRAYHKEADDKVWLMRSYNFKTKEPIHEVGRAGCERILATYDDIPEEGYDNWERGFWMGVLGTLRWVLGDEEKDNLDT